MNSASRLLRVVETFNNNAGATLTALWSSFLEAPSTEEGNEMVFAAVQAFLGEIRQAQLKLSQLGAPPQLFDRYASILRNSFTPIQLASTWANHKNAGSEPMLQTLRWASWALEKFNENDIDAATFEKLLVDLAAQDERLQDPAIPPAMKEMLQRHANALRVSLQLYKIQGVSPIREAVHTAVGEVISEKRLDDDMLKGSNEPTKTAVTKGLEVLTRIAEVADKGSKVAKFAQEMYGWWEKGIGYMQSTGGTLPLPPGGGMSI